MFRKSVVSLICDGDPVMRGFKKYECKVLGKVCCDLAGLHCGQRTTVKTSELGGEVSQERLGVNAEAGIMLRRASLGSGLRMY